MTRSTKRPGAALVAVIAAATLFTVGRSVVIARQGMRLPRSVTMAVAAGQSHVEKAESGPGVDLGALARALDRRDPMSGASAHLETPSSDGGAPRPARQSTPSAPGAPSLALVASLGDHAIVRDGAGRDRVVRVGSTVGGWTVRAIESGRVHITSGTRDAVITRRAAHVQIDDTEQ